MTQGDVETDHQTLFQKIKRLDALAVASSEEIKGLVAVLSEEGREAMWERLADGLPAFDRLSAEAARLRAHDLDAEELRHPAAAIVMEIIDRQAEIVAMILRDAGHGPTLN